MRNNDIRWVKKHDLWIPKHQKRRWYQGKTGWDWLQLVLQAIGAIAIPASIIIGLYQFNIQQQGSSAEALQQQRNQLMNLVEQERQTTLETYFDRMSDLLLNGNLHGSKPGDPVRALARARTLAALPTLDPLRKGFLLTFLYEAGLITKDKSIIDMSSANLSFAELHHADLHAADLHDTDMFEADLNEAGLFSTNLSDTDLMLADLIYANLTYANLSDATLFSADLAHATLIYANLTYVNLNGHADLTSAILDYANLMSAELIDANLTSAILIGAILDYANLSGANLSGANLKFANLSHCDLSNANLYGASVTNKQLATARSLKGTILPNGIKHP